MNIVFFLNELFDDALAQKASDIHFCATENGISVFFRINGVLSKYNEIDNEYKDNLISRIKILINADISKRMVPQEGRFSYSNELLTDVDMRVVIMPSVMGETAVIRILNRKDMLLGLKELSMPDECVETFINSINKGAGLNLICGATGSGKTTTLYASLMELSEKQSNIVTVEDPVEYIFNGITQIQIDHNNEVLFPNSLKYVLRMDPDVILIGEIRDAETAEIACSAALTGHLVIATIHSNDAVSAVMRLVDMGIDYYLIANALKLVVHQELIPVLCKNCLGDGCDKCLNTGVENRVAVFEMLRVSQKLKDKLIKGGFEGKFSDKEMSGGFYFSKENSLSLLKQKKVITEKDYLYYTGRNAG